VTVHPYDGVEKAMSEYKDKENKKLTVSPGDCSAKYDAMFKSMGFDIVEKDDVIALIKCNKNEVMQEGMRQANIRDCAAIMKYFAFLEEEL